MPTQHDRGEPHNVFGGPGDFLTWRYASGGTAEIEDVQVVSERRNGRGRQMVFNMLVEIEKEHPTIKMVWAITRSTNKIAQHFYEELRFRVVGVLRNFYKDEGLDGVDAIMYGRDVERSLDGSQSS